MHAHAILVVVSYSCWFAMVFFLFVSCLAFYVRGQGNWLGKRKVNEAQGELNEA